MLHCKHLTITVKRKNMAHYKILTPLAQQPLSAKTKSAPKLFYMYSVLQISKLTPFFVCFYVISGRRFCVYTHSHG